MTERDFAVEVVRTLQQAGFRALWAGGCVRDELLGLHPHDFDVATDARPEQVMKLFRRSLAVGAAFGVIEVIGPRGPHRKHLTVEVATFRSDGTYSDGRRPDSITFCSAEEDARRRDFTINGLFFDPLAGEVFDYVGGKADLEARLLRAIGDPMARFTEDKLRVLRGVRVATRFDLRIDPATLAAAREIAPQIAVVSAERIAEELRKLLAHPNRGRGVKLLQEFGLVPHLVPELAAQWDESVRVVQGLDREATFELAFAALLHPLPNPQVERIAARLKLSTAESARITWLVAMQDALKDAESMRPSRLKPILVHPGIEDLLALHRALAAAEGRGTHSVEYCEKVLRETPPEELNPPPLLTGSDLIAMGLAPGPEFKRLLDAVREAQLDGVDRSKEDALRRVLAMQAAPDPPA